MKALILIDIQNDFLPGGALAVEEGDVIVPVINHLQTYFELVVATQDWHPVDHQSFAVNHNNKKTGDTVMLNGLPQILWPVHCVEGTAGAAFAEKLDRSRIKKVFYKGVDRQIDSYSGFFDNGHLKSTGLADYLSERGVDTVYIAGLATDYCVKYTAMDAAALGFKTFVIKDACKGVDLQPGGVEKAFIEMRRSGIQIIESQDEFYPFEL